MDTIQHMELLDMVVFETLRLHPAIGISFSECSEDYKLPSGIVIKKGIGIHRDEKYFPNHDKFDLTRLRKESCAGQHPMAFKPWASHVHWNEICHAENQSGHNTYFKRF
jgi:cytochrome P450